MDTGWALGPQDKSEPERTLIIRSKTFFNKITLGTVSRMMNTEEPGFWFFIVQGTRVHFSGRW